MGEEQRFCDNCIAMTEDTTLRPDEQIKATINVDDARQIVEKLYGFPVKNIIELSAYYDRNFHILCEDERSHASFIAKEGYVLKVINSLDSKNIEFIEAQNDLLLFLDEKGITCTTPIKQKDGSYYSLESFNNSGVEHVIRLLKYCKGEVLSEVPMDEELLKNIGFFTARLDDTLQEFWHPAYDKQTTLWVLSAVPKVRDFIFALTDRNEIDIVEQVISNFEENVLTITDILEKGIIHGDLNEFNIIINSDDKSVGAIIDFGDSHKNCFIFELAICLSHIICQINDIEKARHVIAGYQQIRRLTTEEKSILKLCVCARIAQVLVLVTHSMQQEPENNYLAATDRPTKWQILKKLWSMDDDELMQIWGFKD